jgi:hypothetical protein
VFYIWSSLVLHALNTAMLVNIEYMWGKEMGIQRSSWLDHCELHKHLIAPFVWLLPLPAAPDDFPWKSEQRNIMGIQHSTKLQRPYQYQCCCLVRAPLFASFCSFDEEEAKTHSPAPPYRIITARSSPGRHNLKKKFSKEAGEWELRFGCVANLFFASVFIYLFISIIHSLDRVQFGYCTRLFRKSSTTFQRHVLFGFLPTYFSLPSKSWIVQFF